MKKNDALLKSKDKQKINRKRRIFNAVTFIKIISDIIKNIYEIIKK